MCNDDTIKDAVMLQMLRNQMIMMKYLNKTNTLTDDINVNIYDTKSMISSYKHFVQKGNK